MPIEMPMDRALASELAPGNVSNLYHLLYRHESRARVGSATEVVVGGGSGQRVEDRRHRGGRCYYQFLGERGVVVCLVGVLELDRGRLTQRFPVRNSVNRAALWLSI